MFSAPLENPNCTPVEKYWSLFLFTLLLQQVTAFMSSCDLVTRFVTFLGGKVRTPQNYLSQEPFPYTLYVDRLYQSRQQHCFAIKKLMHVQRDRGSLKNEVVGVL